MPVGKCKDVKLASGEVVKLKSNFKVADKLGAFYSGGQVELSKDGQHLFTTCGSAVNVVSCTTGLVEKCIEEEEDHVTSLAVCEVRDELVVGWRSLLIKQYNWKSGKCSRSWKGHLGPVVSMAFDQSSTLLASGSSDSTVKVWDLEKQYCTHNLRGSKGVVHLVRFHPSPDALKLFTSAAVECSIRVWDLRTSVCVRMLQGHVSCVTSLGFSGDGHFMLSGGRDQVVHVWDLASGLTTKTVPVFESVEALVVLPDDLVKEAGLLLESDTIQYRDHQDGIVFATAGSKGCIRVWNSRKKDQPLASLDPLDGGSNGNDDMLNMEKDVDEEGGRGTHETVPSEGGYSGLSYCGNTRQLVAVTYDHNVVFFDTPSFGVNKQLVGYLDEVVDMKFAGDQEEFLVVANNSEQVKVFNRSSSDCQLLTGHGGVVLSLDVSSDGCTLVTGSKDNSVRMWRLDKSAGQFSCVARGTGHTHVVGAVAISRLRGNFIVSGSQDCTLKCWTLKKVSDAVVTRLKVKYTQLAHDKDVNSIDLSPNDRLIVTGSQDKTAKLWQAATGEQLGVFRGHKRGLWSVRFSPVDQCVLTGSADATIKLWAIEDFSCIKTFEGHSNSVLKAVFISRGMQIASSGSDGLVKIWTIRTNECVSTLDEHTEKVWSLAISADGDLLVSGGADSVICQWKDVTEDVAAEAKAEEERVLLQEQELSNYIKQKNYLKAVGVAITLDQPFRVLNILQELLERCGPDGQFSATICSLGDNQLYSLLRYASLWNQNARHSYVAQSVLSVVLQKYPPEKLMAIEDLHKLLERLIPYTQRHMQRLLRLQQLSKFVDYTVQVMKLPGLRDKCEEYDLTDAAMTTEAEHPSSQQAILNSTQVYMPPDSTTLLDPDENAVTDKPGDGPQLGTEGYVTSTTGSAEDEGKVTKKPRRLQRKEILKAIAKKKIKSRKKFQDSMTVQA